MTWRDPPPDAMPVAFDEVHVWRAALDVADDVRLRLAATLAGDEAARAARFHFARDRDRFTVAHGALRAVLAAYLDVAGPVLRFAYGSAGKPSLAPDTGADWLRFNLTHSAGIALIAIARGRDIGVDIESGAEGVDREPLAHRFFSAAEVSALERLPVEARPRAFYTCWTRKEAYIKALGAGLSLPLDSFDVSLRPDEAPALLRPSAAARRPGPWTLLDVAIEAPFVAAVAVEGGECRLVCWQWNAEGRV